MGYIHKAMMTKEVVAHGKEIRFIHHNRKIHDQVQEALHMSQQRTRPGRINTMQIISFVQEIELELTFKRSILQRKIGTLDMAFIPSSSRLERTHSN
jgi:hypothetical protein